MWPRTIEILDQLDLAERLIQIGVVTRNALHFRESVPFCLQSPDTDYLLQRTAEYRRAYVRKPYGQAGRVVVSVPWVFLRI
jgi:hypothetical protein